MKKVLAIRGHYQKGNEVIKILEMQWLWLNSYSF